MQSHSGRFLDPEKPYGLSCKYSPCINTMFIVFVLNHEKMVRAGKKTKKTSYRSGSAVDISPPFPQENLHNSWWPPSVVCQVQKEATNSWNGAQLLWLQRSDPEGAQGKEGAHGSGRAGGGTGRALGEGERASGLNVCGWVSANPCALPPHRWWMTAV